MRHLPVPSCVGITGRTDKRGRSWWGYPCELCPDDLVSELNGCADHARITELMKRYRAQKR
ncbi:hypothetical protein ACIQJT_18240 [Streptomyces sp. NPDC091972]|uniref:hypothetical protein n=1 Tax=unclassified Streptomyces TaxID=2593676 RepID=UPI003444658C